MKMTLREYFQIEVQARWMNRFKKLPPLWFENLACFFLVLFFRAAVYMGLTKDPRKGEQNEQRYEALMWYRFKEMQETSFRINSKTQSDKHAELARTYFLAYHKLLNKAKSEKDEQQRAIHETAAMECLKLSKENMERAGVLIPIEKGLIDQTILKALQSEDFS